MAKIITEIPSISNIGVPEAPIDGIQYGREDATWTPINDISYTDEQAQDAIGTILLNTATIDLSYNDGTPSISADVKPNSIDSSHLSNSINVSEFVNDSDYATETYVDSKIPSNYSKVVYVDSNNPNTATIFDVNNPPTVNDDTLKTDVNNLYVGLNASTWVYNSTSLTYITEPITSGTSNFYLGGTLIDALGNKITAIERTGPVGVGTAIASNHAVTKAQHDTKQVKDEQIEISANSNVQNAWHGQTILFTANCTITVPATLNNQLMFPFRTLTGVTVTWAITAPFTWETTPTATPGKTVGHFMRRGSTNTIFLDV